jgi:hypothetical protein
MTETELDNLIIKLGKAHLANNKSFEKIAEQESGDLSVRDLLRLDYKLMNNLPGYPGVNEGKLSPGGWHVACKLAIFELIYNIGIDAHEYLTSVTFDEYACNQQEALNILCRLYAAGKLPRDIIKQVDDNFESFDYEIKRNFVQYLLEKKKHDPMYEDIFKQMKSNYFLYVITALAKDAGALHTTREELIALGKRITVQGGHEEDIQALMNTFDLHVPYPQGSRLFYFPEGYDGSVDELPDYNPTVEEVVDKCLAYKPTNEDVANDTPGAY